MIIKGKSRAGPSALAAHLGNAEKNERVTLLETRGTVADDLRGALVEMDAYALGTRCEKSLYHAAISPALPHRLTPEQRLDAVNALEIKLGLVGHSRVVVLHEKLGREHLHVVWSRIDLERMKSVSDSHNYRKHEEVARELERLFGHERVQGAHHERDGVERPDRTPSRAELRQEERTGIKGRNVKAEVTAAFQSSDTSDAFRAALQDAGYVLARGDRRDFVVVDRAGGIHSLARRIDGIKAGALREFMASIDREKLPTIEQARDIAKKLRMKLEAHAEAKREASYSRADDYVSQTQAALRDHLQRQERLNRNSRADTLWDRIEAGEKGRNRVSDCRLPTKDAHKQPNTKTETREMPAEASDVRRLRMKRLREAKDAVEKRTHEKDDGPPDRQPGAPGGGRTRSR